MYKIKIIEIRCIHDVVHGVIVTTCNLTPYFKGDSIASHFFQNILYWMIIAA
jgi:hypothetical protein